MLGTSEYANAIASRNDANGLDPADWDFRGEYYVGPSEEMADAYGHARWDDDIPFANDDLGKCGHCGTPHYHGAVFHNHKTGEWLAIGNVCASQFFEFPSKKAYFEAQAAKAKKCREQREEAERQAAQFLVDRPELVEAFKTEHHIIQDIHGKLRKYGSISEKQADLVLKIAREAAERIAEPKPQPIPEELLEGRHEFKGVVLGFKEQESPFGGSFYHGPNMITKMVFRDDRGFTLYGTAVSTDDGYDKGDRVAFFARVERSDRDKCFGFFSRPTKARTLDTEGSGRNAESAE
jgi:hypothetical protein